MIDNKKLTAFVANIRIGEELSPMTYEEAVSLIWEWMSEGSELPEGITATKLVNEWNQQYVLDFIREAKRKQEKEYNGNVPADVLYGNVRIALKNLNLYANNEPLVEV